MSKLYGFFTNLPFSSEVTTHVEDHLWCESVTMTGKLATGGTATYVDQMALTGLERVIFEVDGVEYIVSHWDDYDNPEWTLDSSALGVGLLDEKLILPGEYQKVAPHFWRPFREKLGDLVHDAVLRGPEALEAAMSAYWNAHGETFSPDGEYACGDDMYFVSFDAPGLWSVVRTRDGHEWTGRA